MPPPFARPLVLALFLFALAPGARAAEPDGYTGLHPYRGDTHVHSGSPAGAYLQSLPSWDPNCVDCPSVWCTRMYAFAKQAGYDWVVSTSHEGSLPSYYKPGDPLGGLAMTPEILAWWKSARPNYSNPAHPQDVYPTSPAGFPLYDGSGGHTDDQIASLSSCADAATENGRFVAFFGIEYTAAPAGEMGCRTESVGCGGHKTAIFPRLRDRAKGERACTGTSKSFPYDDQCRTLGDFYHQVAALGGVVNVAHPNFGPKPGLEPFATTPTGDNGGIDPKLVVGVEIAETSPEATPGLEHTYPGKYLHVPGLNLAGFLARGFHVHPVFGSDVHFRPTATAWAGNPRGATTCWAPELTRAALLDAMRAHRCYFAVDGIQVRFGVEQAIMGATLASDAIDVKQGLRVRLDATGKSPVYGMSDWILMHGQVRKPPQKPAPIALPAGASACGAPPFSAHCSADLRVTLPGATRPADYEGFYYAILRRGGSEVAVSAPIWIEPPPH